MPVVCSIRRSHNFDESVMVCQILLSTICIWGYSQEKTPRFGGFLTAINFPRWKDRRSHEWVSSSTVSNNDIGKMHDFLVENHCVSKRVIDSIGSQCRDGSSLYTIARDSNQKSLIFFKRKLESRARSRQNTNLSAFIPQENVSKVNLDHKSLLGTKIYTGRQIC